MTNELKIDWNAVDERTEKKRVAELRRVIDNLTGEHGALKIISNWTDVAEIDAGTFGIMVEHPSEIYKASQMVAKTAERLDFLIEALRWFAGGLRVSAARLGDNDEIRNALDDYQKRKIKALENALEKTYSDGAA